jgi:hypothetical protein
VHMMVTGYKRFPVRVWFTWVDWASSSLALTIQHGTCGTEFFVAFRTTPLYQNALFPFRFPIQVIWLSPEHPPSSGSFHERYLLALIVALLVQGAHLRQHQRGGVARVVDDWSFFRRLPGQAYTQLQGGPDADRRLRSNPFDGE